MAHSREKAFHRVVFRLYFKYKTKANSTPSTKQIKTKCLTTVKKMH